MFEPLEHVTEEVHRWAHLDVTSLSDEELFSASPSTTVTGALEMGDEGRGTFTADQGGSVSFVRMRPNQFGDLSCPIP